MGFGGHLHPCMGNGGQNMLLVLDIFADTLPKSRHQGVEAQLCRAPLCLGKLVPIWTTCCHQAESNQWAFFNSISTLAWTHFQMRWSFSWWRKYLHVVFWLVGFFMSWKWFPIKDMTEMTPDAEPGAGPISTPTDEEHPNLLVPWQNPLSLDTPQHESRRAHSTGEDA